MESCQVIAARYRVYPTALQLLHATTAERRMEDLPIKVTLNQSINQVSLVIFDLNGSPEQEITCAARLVTKGQTSPWKTCDFLKLSSPRL